MAESRRFALNPHLDIAQILQESKTRWLRPSEICEIIRNYQRLQLTPDPPYKPPGGTLFLFDRKTLRYFRKDGHNWRKKSDGKTVREAHEKLKCGSVDVLHCHYAHGEDNENFQRRSYWMLDGKLEHIVLVHYRDVNEGSRPTASHLLSTDPSRVDHAEGTQPSSFAQLNPLSYARPAAYTSSSSAVDWSGQGPSSKIEDADSGEELAGASHVESTPCCLFDPLFANQVPLQNLILSMEPQQSNGALQGSFSGSCIENSPVKCKWADFGSISNNVNMQEQNISFGQSWCSRNTPRTVKDDSVDIASDAEYNLPLNVRPSIFSSGNDRQNQNGEHIVPVEEEQLVTEPSHVYCETKERLSSTTAQFAKNSGSQVGIATSNQPQGDGTEYSSYVESNIEPDVPNDAYGGLNKLDSFGRWMNKEIGKDIDDSLMASDSCNYWVTLDTPGDDKEVSTLSRQMQLDIDSLGPSLSREQLFSILDFSPDWGFSNVETRVLISGSFLGGVDPRSIKWCCMFGAVEVFAEVLTASTLRCQAPAHASGRVPFYVTCSNRLACSEVREFEYRENMSLTSSLSEHETQDEFHLQVRFAKLLDGMDEAALICLVESCHKCEIKKNLYQFLKYDEDEWVKIDMKTKLDMNFHKDARGQLIQKLLKDKLYQWLVCKVHEEGRGSSVLDGEGHGAIHLAAALGYKWAMAPLVASGVNPSFRDARGWTGLHWAAYYGREEMVSVLVDLGADPGAVEDPTSKHPQGGTAADLASARGHKGIAGYLAEAHLTSHLSSLALRENSTHNLSADHASEKAIECVQGKNMVSASSHRDQLSLRASLAAVRNSAQAAARIQAAFRARSFRQRQLIEDREQVTEIPGELMVLSLCNKMQKVGHFNESLHTAAVKIQQKYRGWKGRKNFLKIRDKIVRIQAHVRGHQVRKQYRAVVWSVSIVEKAILRWRRKGAGLRGFRAEKVASAVDQLAGKADEYDFLRLGRKQKEAGVEKALARVHSMARSPEARDQYMRLVASSRKSKLGDDGSSSQ